MFCGSGIALADGLCAAIYHNILDFSARVLATVGVEHPLGLKSTISSNGRDPKRVRTHFPNFARDSKSLFARKPLGSAFRSPDFANLLVYSKCRARRLFVAL